MWTEREGQQLWRYYFQAEGQDNFGPTLSLSLPEINIVALGKAPEKLVCVQLVFLWCEK